MTAAERSSGEVISVGVAVTVRLSVLGRFGVELAACGKSGETMGVVIDNEPDRGAVESLADVKVSIGEAPSVDCGAGT